MKHKNDIFYDDLDEVNKHAYDVYTAPKELYTSTAFNANKRIRISKQST